jgi:succinate-semialdehyde dehydrogenase / glutarate-semialdehyde dehydrogenase
VIANGTQFGLGSAIFTQDWDEAPQAIDRIAAGSTFENAKVASDPRLPFGGVKVSGYGRELSRHGTMKFVNQKTVSVA